ncbi:MAG TPA: electron transfer flavoprotein subunit beta/FixA family protein [Ramlibacter sp.]|nr:electron transfer flavoprotein subunit beta/FixA family protein [Ramlibacter sp.]
MKILVALKSVPDPNVRLRLKSDGSGIDPASLKMSTNPFDENALEEAVRLKDQGHAKEIVAVSVGPQQCEETLRTALAIGATRAIHVSTPKAPEPLCVAKILKAICEREQPRLALLGRQAIDDDCNQTGQMLAALLGWPQGTFASKVDVLEQEVEVRREIDGGQQVLRLRLPAVVTADLRLNEPRRPSFPNIVKSKRAGLEKLTPEDLGVQVAVGIETLKLEEPPVRQAGRVLGSVQELVELLRTEARVI